MEIYLDESGNLGQLGARASKADPYFVIAALIVKDDLPIKRCIKDIRRRKIKKKYKVRSELKFSNSDEIMSIQNSAHVFRPDFVAGAISRKYRDNDDQYYQKIQNRVSVVLDFFEPDIREL